MDGITDLGSRRREVAASNGTPVSMKTVLGNLANMSSFWTLVCMVHVPSTSIPLSPSLSFFLSVSLSLSLALSLPPSLPLCLSLSLLRSNLFVDQVWQVLCALKLSSWLSWQWRKSNNLGFQRKSDHILSVAGAHVTGLWSTPRHVAVTAGPLSRGLLCSVCAVWGSHTRLDYGLGLYIRVGVLCWILAAVLSSNIPEALAFIVGIAPLS